MTHNKEAIIHGARFRRFVRIMRESILLLIVTASNMFAAADAQARAAAETLTLLPLPANDATKITLPTLPAQYASDFTVEISESDKPDVVDVHGNITRSGTETTGVRLTLKVTNKTTGAYAYTKPLLVPIYKTYLAPTMTQEDIDEAFDTYSKMKYGFMTTYASNDHPKWPPNRYPDGTKPLTIDDVAEGFDVEQFAKDMNDFGVEYVTFTCWHADVRPLFPSMTSRRWRDDRRVNEGAKTYSDRDVISDLLNELDKYGIDLFLYVHPNDAKDMTEEDQALCGADIAADNYAVWNQYTNELFYEMCERYGTRIKGLWIDGGTSARMQNNAANYGRLRATCKTFNPALILVFNAQFTYTAKPIYNSYIADYLSWESNHRSNLNVFPVTNNQVTIALGYTWWSMVPQTEQTAINTPEEILRYIAAQASISVAGGTLGSYANYVMGEGNDPETEMWSVGFKEVFTQVGTWLSYVGESIKNTSIGKAYVTPENSVITMPADTQSYARNPIDWGVSTESPDGKYVYLHVLNAPTGDTLTLPATADGSKLAKTATILGLNGSTTLIEIVELENGGYAITLPEGTDWSEVDTVIKAIKYF
jgi:hypothetical protein